MPRPKGFKHSEETKRKIGLIHKNKIVSDITKSKISKAKIGVKLTKEHKMKICLSHIGKHHSEISKQKMSKNSKGKVMSEESKIKNRLSHLGIPNKKSSETKIKLFKEGKLIQWNKGKHMWKNKKHPRLGIKHTDKVKKQIQEARIKQVFTPQQIKKRFKHNKISCLEQKMIDIINKYNLPYKFVGNGDFIIEQKCPDFINCNGEKIAIEVYYKRHKEIFGQAKHIGIDEWKQSRQELFNKYGWKILYFDETQVNEDNVKRCLL